jgi:hypothetical protein
MKKVMVSGTVTAKPVQGTGIYGWQNWTPNTAVAWSFIYTAEHLLVGERARFPLWTWNRVRHAGTVARRGC